MGGGRLLATPAGPVLHAYLAVIAVEGLTPFGRPFLDRIGDAVRRYR